MEQSDVWFSICIVADERSLRALMCCSAHVRRMATSQAFWYEKTQRLAGRRLKWPDVPGHWKLVHNMLRYLLETGRADPLSIDSVRMDAFQISVFLELYGPGLDGKGALEIACVLGDVDAVKVILADGRIDPSEQSLFKLTSSHGVVHALLSDERADPRVDESWELTRACMRGDTVLVRLFLEDGRADPTAGSCYGLTQAKSRGYDDIVTLLMTDERVRRAMSA